MPRFPVLDGWRAISILSVMAAHMLPLGPKQYRLNEMVAPLGMALFFTLSGFLITNTLLYHPSVREFVVRRLCRILPLAYLFMLIVLPLTGRPWSAYPDYFLFYANLTLRWLEPPTAHIWSLCLEMQFYLLVALLVSLLGRKGLFILPVLGMTVTIGRVWHGETMSLLTYYRIDEVLAGVTLALLYERFSNRRIPRVLTGIGPYPLAGLLLMSCHEAFPAANYFRPYLAAALVGVTLFQGRTGSSWLKSQTLAYIAEISYALYLIHPLTTVGWFDPADKVLKYARRPVAIAITWALAHFSTRYYESWWIALGKRALRCFPEVSPREITLS